LSFLDESRKLAMANDISSTPSLVAGKSKNGNKKRKGEG
jgi:hypothetical protein